MLLHLGSKPMVVASSVDAARDIMKTHDLVWSNRPKSKMADRLFYGSKDVAFSPYGEYWRQVRSVTVLHLLSNKRVQSFRDVLEEEISNMIENNRQECEFSRSVIDLRDFFCSLTNTIISRVALGRKYNEGESGINGNATLDGFVNLLGTFNVGEYIPWLEWFNKISGLDTKVEKAAKETDTFLENVIEEHIRKGEYCSGEAKDFVDVLLEIQINGDETGYPLQRDSLKAILLAGGAIAFGIIVNELALARLVHKFNFALPERMKGEDLDMTEGTGITIRRQSPLLAVITPYSS
ncbi:cytochrome P450 71A4-like isoform X1 [Nicotiana tabacum]|uniref:Cytochrome P450 71A2-like isoform X1 n=1 Tax=Nicotiana tabacum TaxID=4097 RepID=A0A1S3X4F9_TOBAC|nr:PREDICTED: cytochrome P450 71A2-like isoform X1 [Nicotiana tabacum]